MNILKAGGFVDSEVHVFVAPENFTEYYEEGDYADSAEFLAKQASYTQEFLNFLIILCEDFKYLDEVLMFITVIFGVITNILCIVVFARPNFKKTNMGIYYINISAWNIIYLLLYMLVFDSYNVYYIDLKLLSEAVCKITVFLQNFLRQIPPWFEVYLTFDRYLAVCHPTKYKKIRERKYITPICFLLVALLAIANIESFWYHLNHHVKPSHEGISSVQLGYHPYVNVSKGYYISKCMAKESIALSVDVISIMFRFVLPAFLMCVFSFLIVKTVIESKKKTARKQSSVSIDKQKAKKSRESSFTNTVIYMNIIFIILNTPVTIMLFVIHVYHSDYDVFTDSIIGNLYLITFDISNLYYGLRFVFNLIFNKVFQDEFFLMFHLKKKSEFSSKTSKTKGVSTRAGISTHGPVSTFR